jgi:hypothetical protein
MQEHPAVPPGTCWCGCGEATPIAVSRGHGRLVVGEHTHWLPGHHQRAIWAERPRRSATSTRYDPPAAPSPTLTPGNVSALVQACEHAFHVPAGTIGAYDRTGRAPDARHACWWALAKCGAPPSWLGRHFERNHSSIWYGVSRVADRPDLQAIVRPLIAAYRHGEPPSAVPALLEETLPPTLDLRERRAIRAYVSCTLLGWERAPGPLCGVGLWLVGRLPAVRAAVETVLRQCTLDAYCTTLARQTAPYVRKEGH